MTAPLRGLVLGTGYFSQFHLEAWSRIPSVAITAVCDPDTRRAEDACARFAIPRHYTDAAEAIAAERPDFADIVTRPATHLGLCEMAAERGIPIICQKPLAPTFDEAQKLVAVCSAARVRLMVHENFRFQPWHREIRRLLAARAVGTTLHSLTFRSRPGDGWGTDAYLGRQPYFRTMPRFLIHETGVHFIDTFRFLAGEVDRVHCVLRRLNPAIAGEDCGLLVFEFASGAVGLWDANRYNESSCADPRYTFGEFLVEADGGSIRLDADGTLFLKPLGQPERVHDYPHDHRGFGGDCVHATQSHFIERLLSGQPFETDGSAYLKTLAIVDAFYASYQRRRPVTLTRRSPGRGRRPLNRG